MSAIEASRILPRLWQGSVPPQGDALRRAGFHVLILCAMEHQPPADRFPGVAVIHAPNDDADRPPTTKELCQAISAAIQVAGALDLGLRVLVTCAAGRNRSGLVTAISLCLTTGCAGPQAVRFVQTKRAGALTNGHFVYALSALTAGPDGVRVARSAHKQAFRR